MKWLSVIALTAALCGCGISDHPLPPDDSPSSFAPPPPIDAEARRDDRFAAKKAVDELIAATLAFRAATGHWPITEMELVDFAAAHEKPLNRRAFKSLEFLPNAEDDTETLIIDQGRLLGPAKITLKAADAIPAPSAK